MKTLKKLIVVFCLLAPSVTMAQSKSFDQLYNEYSGKKGASTVMMSGDMINISGKGGSPDTKLKGMKIISLEKSLTVGTADINRLRDEAIALASGTGYKLIMDVRDDDEIVKIYARNTGKQGVMNGVVIITAENDEVSVIFIEGEIDSRDINRIRHTNDD